jgi:hypothetical protein
MPCASRLNILRSLTACSMFGDGKEKWFRLKLETQLAAPNPRIAGKRTAKAHMPWRRAPLPSTLSAPRLPQPTAYSRGPFLDFFDSPRKSANGDTFIDLPHVILSRCQQQSGILARAEERRGPARLNSRRCNLRGKTAVDYTSLAAALLIFRLISELIFRLIFPSLPHVVSR